MTLVKAQVFILVSVTLSMLINWLGLRFNIDILLAKLVYPEKSNMLTLT